MFWFKSLFKFLLVFSTMATVEPGSEEIVLAPDANGWVALDHPIKRPIDTDLEHDASIWVLFSKQLEGESFRVRFPVDPEYHYLSSFEEMEMIAKSGEDEFSLQVFRSMTPEELIQKIDTLYSSSNISFIEVRQADENIYDVQYREEGKWVRQHAYSSLNHLYILQTKMALFAPEQHEAFINSFEIIT